MALVYQALQAYLMPNYLPVAALLFNAFVWGVSWWPFRHLQAAGLHPLWATALMYLLALACLLVLLFYLMPAWSVLLAWRFLGEVPTPLALLRLLLAFGGVVLVVLPPGMPLTQLAQGLSPVDLLAVAGGFAFALTNVTLRRLHQVPEQARMLAMFGGGALMAALVAVLGMAVGIVTPVPAVAIGWVLVALGLTLAFLLGNYALQYGAARLAAGTTALVMLTEVVFASTSSWLLDAAALQLRTLAGGACIMLAALLAVVPARRRLTQTG